MPARSPEVSIHVDRPDRTFSPGDSIRGHVRIEGPSRGELVLELGWRTSGRGNVDRDRALRLTLIDTGLPGTTRALPFEVTAPDGPPTFQGHFVRLDWVISVRTPGRMLRPSDPLAEEDLVITGARETVLASARQRQRRRRRGLSRIQGGTALTALGLLLAGAALGAIGWSARGDLLCPCSIFGLILLGSGVAALRNPLAARRLGRVHLELSEEVSPGESLRVRLEIEPPWQVALNGIWLRLEGEERATSGSGSDARTERRNVFLKRVNLCEREIVHGPRTWEAEIPLSAEVPVSFSTGNNELHYELELRIDIPGWPDWHVKVPILVLPDGQRQRVQTARPALARRIDLQPRQRCPYCRDGLIEGDEPVVVCGVCRTVLHEGCWAEIGRCPTTGCVGEQPSGRYRARNPRVGGA